MEAKGIETGGPAFPVPGFEYLNDADEENPERVAYIPHPGMTIRDYFAAKAMQTLLSRDHMEHASRGIGTEPMIDLPKAAYAWADAMIAARAK